MKRVTEPKLRAGRGSNAGTPVHAGTTDPAECVHPWALSESVVVGPMSDARRRGASAVCLSLCLSVCLSFFRLGLGQKLTEHAPTPHFFGCSLDIYPLLLRPQGGLTHSRPMHRESIMPVLTPRALAAPRYWVPVDDEDLWCLARVESRSGGSVKLSRSRAPPGCVRVPHGLACKPYRAVRGMPCRVQRGRTVPCRACRMDGRYHRRA